MTDFVAQINDRGAKVPAKLKTALNKFFNDVDCAEGCILRSGKEQGETADIVLIIESSDLFSYLTGEYGWSVHTKFMNAFTNTGYCMEMLNSCVVGFYKD